MKSSVNKWSYEYESIHIFCNWTQPIFFIMSLPNNISFHPNTFLLVGIPGMEAIHTWISIPFCLIYLTALLGSFSILFIIRTDSNLHEPMYFFLCMLSVADLILSTTAMPKILSIFWFHDREIYFEACLVQVFLIHSLCSMASGFILAMAFDRYVAICNPLRHSIILTHRVIQNVGLAIIFRGVVLFCPQPFMLWWLPYCRTNVIPHTYCEFMALIKLACAETRICRTYSLTAAFLTGGLDFILILCSYVVILYTVFHLPSKAARLKTWALVDPMCVWSWWPILQPFSPSLLTDLDTMWLLIFTSLWLTSMSLFHPWWTQWSMA